MEPRVRVALDPRFAVSLRPSLWRARAVHRVLVPFEALTAPVSVELEVDGALGDVGLATTVDAPLEFTDPTRLPSALSQPRVEVRSVPGRRTIARVTGTLPFAPEVGRHTLRVALAHATPGGWRIDEPLEVELLLIPGQIRPPWSGRDVPEDLAVLTTRLARGTRSPVEALDRFVSELQDDGPAWLYRSDGASCLSDHREGAAVLLLDLLLGLGMCGTWAAGTVAVDCQALARLVASAGALLGCEVWTVRLLDDGSFLPDASLGTNRVLPLGDSKWRYPDPTGTLLFHEVAVVGDPDRRDTWRIYDASFRLDRADAHLRPHDASAVVGWPLPQYLERLVPEVASGRWRLSEQPRWPKAFPVQLAVVDQEPCWMIRAGESQGAFLERYAAAPGWALRLLDELRAHKFDVVGLCVPDPYRIVAFLENDGTPVFMEGRFKLPADVGFLPVPGPDDVQVHLRAVGQAPRTLDRLARRLGRTP